jgi:hypothetical protein
VIGKVSLNLLLAPEIQKEIKKEKATKNKLITEKGAAWR